MRLKEKDNVSAEVLNNIPIELPLKSTQDVNVLEEYLNEEGKISALVSNYVARTLLYT